MSKSRNKKRDKLITILVQEVVPEISALFTNQTTWGESLIVVAGKLGHLEPLLLKDSKQFFFPRKEGGILFIFLRKKGIEQ